MRKFTDIESSYLRERKPFRVGDTVDIGVVITETVEKKGKLEEKERVQVFQGVVIAKNGAGITESFTVRRIVAGEGVERVFPVHSPRIASIDVLRSSHVRRAKLYYLRDRTGKATRLRERIRARAPSSKGASEPSAAAAETPAATS